MGQRLSVVTRVAVGAASHRRIEPSRTMAEDTDRASQVCRLFPLRFSTGRMLIVSRPHSACADSARSRPHPR